MVSKELPDLRTSVSYVLYNVVSIFECCKVEDQCLRPEEYVHIIKVCTCTVSLCCCFCL